VPERRLDSVALEQRAEHIVVAAVGHVHVALLARGDGPTFVGRVTATACIAKQERAVAAAETLGGIDAADAGKDLLRLRRTVVSGTTPAAATTRPTRNIALAAYVCVFCFITRR
jgi:hypothetical protein